MELHFGDKVVQCDDHNLHPHLEHLKESMSQKERDDLFHEARFGADKAAYFSPKPGVHLVLRHDPSGHYTLEKGRH